MALGDSKQNHGVLLGGRQGAGGRGGLRTAAGQRETRCVQLVLKREEGPQPRSVGASRSRTRSGKASPLEPLEGASPAQPLLV